MLVGAFRSEDQDQLDRLRDRPEPVWGPGRELDHLSGGDHQIGFAEQ
jgi:hypothetical protein